MPKKPKNSYGFLEDFDFKKTPAWIKQGEAYLRKNYGDPCDAYQSECIVCRMWAAWQTLKTNTSD